MSTGQGYGDQGYYVSKSTNIVLGKSLSEVVENTVMKFKRMLEVWKEEKCPDGFLKREFRIYTIPYRLKFAESIQMLREIKNALGEIKNVQVTREETNSLTVFNLQYTVFA